MLVKLNKNSLNHEKVQVFNQDAFSFINQAGKRYDRVIIDMPDPHNEAINKLYSREFYTMIRKRMQPDALIVTQSSSPFFTPRTFWCIEQTLASIFPHTLSYQVAIPSFGIWGFNIARLNQLMPNTFKINVPTRYLNQQAMQAAMIFGKDIQKINSPINSIMEPKLYQLYIEDLKI